MEGNQPLHRIAPASRRVFVFKDSFYRVPLKISAIILRIGGNYLWRKARAQMIGKQNMAKE